MDSALKQIRSNCKKLRSSGCTLEDIYRICFDSPEMQMAEFVRDGDYVGMSRGEVKTLCEKAASRLLRKTGLRGRYIGLYGENSIGWVVLFFAILKSGNKPCLLNTVQPREYNRRILSALGADTVLYTGAAPQLAETEIAWEELAEDTGTACRCEYGEFGNEIAIATNGTTLREKICIFTGREISEQILNCEEIIKLNPNICRSYKGRIRMLMLLPLYHIFGLEASFLWFAFAGAVFVFLPDRKPETILRTIRERQVTHVFAVPLFWNAIEKEFRRSLRGKTDAEREKFEKNVRLSLKLQTVSAAAGNVYARRAFGKVRAELMGNSIRFCISGGSYIDGSTLAFFNALGYPLCNGYGMSEAGITSVELSRKTKDRLRCSIGKPFGSIRYRIDGEGRLLVSGASACKRLYVDGQPAQPAEWFNSGDIAACESDGRYYINGRESDLVLSGTGEKLNPDFAEKAFKLPWAAAFSVLGNQNNDQLIMIVQLPEGLVDIQKKQIEEAFDRCNGALPAAYRVRKVYYTHDPILPEGGIKISRALLRQRMNDGSIRLITTDTRNEADDGGADSEVKRIVREMIAQLLNIEPAQVRGDAHFINDLGGSSLDYLTLISMIDTRFDITMDFEGKAVNYSLNEIAESVEEHLCC